MKKNKGKAKQKIYVKEEVYMSAAYVLLNYKPKEVVPQVDKIMGGHSDNLDDMDNFNGRHFVVENLKRKGDNKLERFVWVKNFDWTCSNIACLTHEILHLVLRILDDRGVPIKEQNSEAIAYLMEFYTREIMRKIK